MQLIEHSMSIRRRCHHFVADANVCPLLADTEQHVSQAGGYAEVVNSPVLARVRLCVMTTIDRAKLAHAAR